MPESTPRDPNPQPSTLNPQPSTLNPQPSTLNPQPSTLNPQPSTLNPQPSTLQETKAYGQQCADLLLEREARNYTRFRFRIENGYAHEPSMLFTIVLGNEIPFFFVPMIKCQLLVNQDFPLF